MAEYTKLSEEEIQNILDMEKNIFDGDRGKAVAAHVVGVGVVQRCAGVPHWLNNYELGRLKGQVTIFEKNQKK